MKKKRKLTPAQKLNNEFEKISTQIVKYLFAGTNASITETKPKKDGGYDIVVECINANVSDKIYFECKLRSGNLNLRDISANMIIAYNEGAAALVVLTNYDYTEQAGSNMQTFYHKSILNIKVIIGSDILYIADKYGMDIQSDLKKIISAKKTNKSSDYKFLRLDLTRGDLYKQILSKTFSDNNDSNSFLENVYKNEICCIHKHLINNENVCVRGLEGIGKTTIINLALLKNKSHVIRIVADNYISQSELLLSVFLNIWGIPLHQIIKDFSDDMVNQIVASVNNKNDDKRAGEIIRNLLGNHSPNGINDENYNYFVCQYLFKLLKMHQTHASYTLYIDNVSYALEEIKKLLVYICKLAKQNQIPYIIEKKDMEYVQNNAVSDDSFYKRLERDCICVKIEYWKTPYPENFVRHELKEYPNKLIRAVLQRGGTRLQTLAMLIAFVKERSKETHSIEVPESELQRFTPNDLPQNIHNLLDFFLEKYAEVFHYFYFTNGKIPISWCEKLSINGDLIDVLVKLNFVSFNEKYIFVANDLVMDEIREFLSSRAYTGRFYAQNMLQFLKTQSACENMHCFINVYDSLKLYNELIPLLKKYMESLYKERQYSLFLNMVDFIFERKVELELELTMQLDLAIHGLIVWGIKRERGCERANNLVIIMKKILFNAEVPNQKYYQMVYDYFNAEFLFQECNFKEAQSITEKYYNQSINFNLITTKNEWLERNCIVFALCQKELMGNEAAWVIFKRLKSIFPNSFFVKMEYLDHKECMHYFKKPALSLKCVHEVLEMFRLSPRYDYPLPFHEYVDRAMCALCAKKYKDALNYSNEAINILDSNDILPSLGRAYNIKGCTLLCIGEIEEAKKCFREANYLLEETKEYLYSWRSRLNLIEMQILCKETDLNMEETLQELEHLYNQFYNLYREKIANLAEQKNFETTREYFALLLFARIYSACGLEKNIFTDFGIQNKCNNYMADLASFCNPNIDSSNFYDCPYVTDKYIFMIG